MTVITFSPMTGQFSDTMIVASTYMLKTFFYLLFAYLALYVKFEIELTIYFLSNFTCLLLTSRELKFRNKNGGSRYSFRSRRTFNRPHNSLNYELSETFIFEPFTSRFVRVERLGER